MLIIEIVNLLYKVHICISSFIYKHLILLNGFINFTGEINCFFEK